MNHRQLNLHNIIKQQQAKIAQLKEQLSLVAKITQTSFLDSEKRNIEMVIEKDDIIVHLKRELDQLRDKYKEYDQLLQTNQRLESEKSYLQAECIKSRDEATEIKQQSGIQQKRIRQLEYKLQSKVQQYQKKLTLLQRQNKRLTNELQSINQTFSLTQNQIDKLTKFYKSSTFDIPKRKQTLLWVDNLIKYMEVNESSSEKKYMELFEFVKGTLGEMEKEVMKAVSEVVVLQEGIVKEGEKVLGEMRRVCEEMKGKQGQMGYGIDELIKMGKKQRDTAEKSQLQNLKHQLQAVTQQSTQTITQLKHRVKQLQTQKKTLVLGFQQIKTFLQNKQTNYKQQIHSLKTTINELLQANQLRQREFEDEIKVLSSQIEAISTRYYENIEYPVMKVNEKVEKELNTVKEELVKLAQENSFRQELMALADKLRAYDKAVAEEDKEFQAIQLCMKKGNELMITIRQLLIEIEGKKSQRKSNSRLKGSQHSAIVQTSNPKPLSQHPSSTHKMTKTPHKQIPIHGPSSIPRHIPNQVSFNQSNVISCHFEYQTSEIQQLKQLQSVVSQIQLKQRESKLSYELGLMKKHNQKLTEHLSAIERKFKQLAGNKMYDEKTMMTYFMNERKLIEVQAELEQVKESNLEYERLLKEEVEKSMKRFEEFKKEVRTLSKEQTAILQALNQLTERHSMIAQILSTRASRMNDLQLSATAINNMLIKPAETFESLVKQFTSQLASLTSIHNHHTARTNPQHWSSINYSQSCRSRLSINESTIREYQEILTKRNQVNSNGSKLIIQLIKTIRETFPVRQNKRRDEINVSEKENLIKTQQQLQNAGKGGAGKAQTFEKKLKQLVTTQQKYKQQLSAKIDKLLQTLNTLEVKRQKQTKLSSGKEKKIQQLLEKYIPTSLNEIKLMIQRESKEHIGLNTEALRDTASKLRESIKENQGLKREMDVLVAVGKNMGQQKPQQQPQNNFYDQV